MGCRLEPRGQLDQRRLAERRSEEADAHRHTEHARRRHLNDRVARPARQTRAGEKKVVGEDQVTRPAGTVGRRNDRVEVELAERGVEAHARIVVEGQRLVVSQPAENRLRIVARVRAAGIHRLRELKDLLEEVRHFSGRVRIVEYDRIRKRLVRHRHTHPRGEILLHVNLEVIEQHEELAVRRDELEARAVEVHHRRARSLDGGQRSIECRNDLRRCVVDALPRGADARTAQPVRIHERRVVGREGGPGAARSLPSERHAACSWIALVGRAAGDHAQRRGRIRDRAPVRPDGVLHVRDGDDPCAAGDADRRLDAHHAVDVRGADDAAVSL